MAQKNGWNKNCFNTHKKEELKILPKIYHTVSGKTRHVCLIQGCGNRRLKDTTVYQLSAGALYHFSERTWVLRTFLTNRLLCNVTKLQLLKFKSHCLATKLKTTSSRSLTEPFYVTRAIFISKYSFVLLLFFNYVKWFKNALHNIRLIYEDTITWKLTKPSGLNWTY